MEVGAGQQDSRAGGCPPSPSGKEQVKIQDLQLLQSGATQAPGHWFLWPQPHFPLVLLLTGHGPRTSSRTYRSTTQGLTRNAAAQTSLQNSKPELAFEP